MKSRYVGLGLIAIACALSVSFQAMATNNTPPSKDPSAVSGSQSGAAALAGAAAGAVAGARSDVAVDASLVGGDSSASAVSGDSNAQAGSTNVIDASTSYQRQVPVLIMGTVIPVDCGFGGQAGGANTHAAGFLGATWTTDRCYTLKVATAWAAMGQYEYACEMLMDVSRKALKRRGIIGVDCVIVGKQLREQHTPPAPVVIHSDVAAEAPKSSYVTPEEMRNYVDKAFKTSMQK